MNKLLLILMCCSVMAGCSSMHIRPTVGVSMGAAL